MHYEYITFSFLRLAVSVLCRGMSKNQRVSTPLLCTAVSSVSCELLFLCTLPPARLLNPDIPSRRIFIRNSGISSRICALLVADALIQKVVQRTCWQSCAVGYLFTLIFQKAQLREILLVKKGEREKTRQRHLRLSVSQQPAILAPLLNKPHHIQIEFI